jgi:hypothetical protein
VNQLPLLDLLLVDGDHTYEVVMSDLIEFTPRLKVGGLLVVDDCGNSLNYEKVRD